MLKPNGSAAKGTGKLAATDEKSWATLPALRSFFLDQTYGSDDAPRDPGCMIVRCTSDGWHCTLKEPSQCLMLKVVGRTWDEMVLLANAFLLDPHAPWETDPYETSRRSRTRKRGS